MSPGPLRLARPLCGALLLLAGFVAAPVSVSRADPADSRPWVVVGRVVNEMRRPVAGADVALCLGAEEVAGLSDSKGDFRLEYDAPPLDVAFATIRARSGSQVATTRLGVKDYSPF